MREYTRKNQDESRRQRAVRHLMLCPLCYALNAVGNDECFGCGWHGEFIEDPERVDAALLELIRLCPDLSIAMPSMAQQPGSAPRKGLWTRLSRYWQRARY